MYFVYQFREFDLSHLTHLMIMFTHCIEKLTPEIMYKN